MTQSLQKLIKARQALAHLNVEASIQKQGQDRFEHGLEKYGVTLDKANLTLYEWLQHHKEELMDAVRYVECQQRELEAKNMITLPFAR